VWHKDHVHQAPVEMQINTNLEDRRDTRDPATIGKALFYQQRWQQARGLTMSMSQIADMYPYMDLSRMEEEPLHSSEIGSQPETDVRYQIETMGPHKGSQITIYPEPRNHSNHQ